MPPAPKVNLGAPFDAVERRMEAKRSGPEPVRFEDLRIWTRDGRLVPFLLNAVQTEYWEEIARLYSPSCGANLLDEPWKLRGARINTLKARQQGFSSFWLGLWYLMFNNVDYTQTVIITHRVESTNMLWQRVQIFERELEKARGKANLRPRKYKNRHELVLEDSGSALFIGTAGQDDLTRSGVITSVHRSETPFWMKGTEGIAIGLLGTLPEWGNNIEESTANGLGPHYDRYQMQKADVGGATRVFFFPWYKTPEYAIEPPPDVLFTPEEIDLAERHRLTDAQLYWRRLKKAAFRAEGQEGKFAQEFPISDEEAFQSSAGDAVFNTVWLQAALEEAERSHKPLYVETPYDSTWKGVFTVYEEPAKGHEYVVTADVAEGTPEVDFEIKGKDYSVAHVYDLETWRQVAHYRGQMTTHQLAADLAFIGERYNLALLVVENNGVGRSCLEMLVRGQESPEVVSPYSNLFYDDEYDEFGQPTGNKLPKPGYASTGQSKAQADAELASEIESRALGQPGMVWFHPNTFREMIKYVYRPNGKRAGQGTSHDDDVRAAAMGKVMLNRYGFFGPRPKPEKREETRNDIYAAARRKR